MAFNRITALPTLLRGAFRLQSEEVPHQLAIDCIQPTAETVQGGWTAGRWDTYDETLTLAAAADQVLVFAANPPEMALVTAVSAGTDAGNAGNMIFRGRISRIQPGLTLGVGLWHEEALAPGDVVSTFDLLRGPVVIPTGFQFWFSIQGTIGDQIGVHVLYQVLPAGVKPI